MNQAFEALLVIRLSVAAQRATRPSTATVELTGILKSRTESGPPGFGETPKEDSKVRIYVLKLEKAKTGQQLGLQPYRRSGMPERFSEVQLRCSDGAVGSCEATLTKLVGRRVTIKGDADGAVYPTDFFPVVVSVHSAAEAGPGRLRTP